MIIEVKLERKDFDAMHDVILEALNLETEINDETIQSIWNRLPKHIQGTAIQWGTNDTVFQDKMFEWLEKNTKDFEI
jgi:hypothetical protein